MKYFTIKELTFSEKAIRHGVDNTPPPEAVENLKRLVMNVLDPLREDLDTPIIPNSGYRNAEVNRLVKGSRNSQHMKGEAADIRAVGLTPYQIMMVIIEMDYPFDQAIYEYGQWVHISHKEAGNRGEVLETLITINEKGKKKLNYIPFEVRA